MIRTMRHFFHKLFARTKWVVVYSTQQVEDHMKCKGRLSEANVEAKTEAVCLGGGEGSGDAFGTTYHILVKAEDVHRANHIIHHGS
ncbi:hypothetical protein EDM56_04980 [Brevibacillus fluminis]|uniref:DUF2007 domain-containing protein n=1 Tax=Brevibacillus fluminis TaxID=511487 RepID=A0A3M8DV62_9BACL|nr:hypothetical protein [Brevibacillus fluminis]RNB91399.1 hypothetical protein EDM56_04980 [Brevibacillus fluminis]